MFNSVGSDPLVTYFILLRSYFAERGPLHGQIFLRGEILMVKRFVYVLHYGLEVLKV